MKEIPWSRLDLDLDRQQMYLPFLKRAVGVFTKTFSSDIDPWPEPVTGENLKDRADEGTIPVVIPPMLRCSDGWFDFEEQ